MKKRIISSLLALSMVVSQLPLTAMAEESTEKSTTEASWGISADLLTEGGTFQQAVDAVNSDMENTVYIKLNDNIKSDTAIFFCEDAVIDFNGFTVSATCEESFITLEGTTADITLKDTSEKANGGLITTHTAFLIADGKLTVEGGRYVSKYGRLFQLYKQSEYDTTITVNDGVFAAIEDTILYSFGGYAELNGGNFICGDRLADFSGGTLKIGDANIDSVYNEAYISLYEAVFDVAEYKNPESLAIYCSVTSEWDSYELPEGYFFVSRYTREIATDGILHSGEYFISNKKSTYTIDYGNGTTTSFNTADEKILFPEYDSTLPEGKEFAYWSVNGNNIPADYEEKIEDGDVIKAIFVNEPENAVSWGANKDNLTESGSFDDLTTATTYSSDIGYARLNADVITNDMIELTAIGCPFILDLNGHTITISDYSLYLFKCFDITITDTSEDEKGGIESVGDDAIEFNDSTLTIDGGVKLTGKYSSAVLMLNCLSGKVTIKDAELTGSHRYGIVGGNFPVCDIVLSGGSYKTYITDDYDPDTSFVIGDNGIDMSGLTEENLPEDYYVLAYQSMAETTLTVGEDVILPEGCTLSDEDGNIVSTLEFDNKYILKKKHDHTSYSYLDVGDPHTHLEYCSICGTDKVISYEPHNFNDSGVCEDCGAEIIVLINGTSIKADTYYDNKLQITDENAESYLYYDSDSNLLTLNNITLTGKGITDDYSNAIVYPYLPMDIEIIGDCRLESADYGICADYSLGITCKDGGTLAINDVYDGINSYMGNITLTNCVIDITGANTHGICIYDGSLAIENCDISIISLDDCIGVYTGDVHIQNSNIDIIYTADDGIDVEDGDICIEDNSTVNICSGDHGIDNDITDTEEYTEIFFTLTDSKLYINAGDDGMDNDGVATIKNSDVNVIAMDNGFDIDNSVKLDNVNLDINSGDSGMEVYDLIAKNSGVCVDGGFIAIDVLTDDNDETEHNAVFENCTIDLASEEEQGLCIGCSYGSVRISQSEGTISTGESLYAIHGTTGTEILESTLNIIGSSDSTEGISSIFGDITIYASTLNISGVYSAIRTNFDQNPEGAVKIIDSDLLLDSTSLAINSLKPVEFGCNMPLLERGTKAENGSTTFLPTEVIGVKGGLETVLYYTTGDKETEVGDSILKVTKSDENNHKITSSDHICDICGFESEHIYTEEVTKKPSCTEDGEMTFTCICGDSYTEAIDNYGGHIDEDNNHLCDREDCDYEYEHNYAEEVTKKPTCKEEGEKTFTCECGKTYTEAIAITDHTDENNDDVCDICDEKLGEADEDSGNSGDSTPPDDDSGDIGDSTPPDDDSGNVGDSTSPDEDTNPPTGVALNSSALIISAITLCTVGYLRKSRKSNK